MPILGFQYFEDVLIDARIQVRDIPCGTKGGVMINFEKIEVHLLGSSFAIIDVRFSCSSS